MLARFGLAMVLSCCALQAQENCPWLNAATAAGALGGSVTVQFVPASASVASATCRFRSSSPEGQIEIEVKPLPAGAKDFAAFSAECRQQGQPLRAIGNEAFACHPAPNTFTVVGRVRDQGFRFTLASSAASENGSFYAAKTRSLAEIVAGNLF
jgi:hypothetical protein